MMRWVRMLSGLLSAAVRRGAADGSRPAAVDVWGDGQPAGRPRAAEAETAEQFYGRPAGGMSMEGFEAGPLERFGVRGGPAARPTGGGAALSGLRRLFLRRGVNVRGDGQLLAAVEEVCRELDAIRAQVGEERLRDMGLADCGTPGSDDEPRGWSGHDDD